MVINVPAGNDMLAVAVVAAAATDVIKTPAGRHGNDNDKLDTVISSERRESFQRLLRCLYRMCNILHTV